MTTLNAWHIARAVRALRAGGVIAYPTEGVWGLGCDPLDAAAVQRLLLLKRRDPSKGLILVAGEARQLRHDIAKLSPEQRSAVLATWPGPVTWILPNEGHWPTGVVGKHSGVAARVSGHLQVRALCLAFGRPIVSTSANPQGQPPARTALAVRHYFRGRLDYLLPGTLGGRGGPSEIREAASGRILRAG